MNPTKQFSDLFQVQVRKENSVPLYEADTLVKSAQRNMSK